MRKNAPLAFRIPDELKRALREIAEKEARSISQICELFLAIGVEGYRTEGAKYLHRLLARPPKTYRREPKE